MSNSEPYCELKNFIFDSKDEVSNPYLQVQWVYTSPNRSVAQLGRAPPSGGGGRRFESFHSDHVFPHMSNS